MIEATKLNSAKLTADTRVSHLVSAFVLMAGTAIVFLSLLLVDENFWRVNVNFYLLPWIAATASVLLAPTFYLIYRKKLDIFHPLVYASWTYWFPSFVVGGLFIATDLIHPYQLTLLGAPESDLIWTYIYIMLGYIGMTLGFCLPIGRRSGEYASSKLPAWNWQPKQVLLPATVFLSIGLFFYVSAFFSGVVGLSLTDVTDAFSTLNYTLSFLSLEAGFLVAMYIFKSPRIKIEHILAFSVILLILVSRLSLAASRSSLLLIVMLLAMAYFYSGRRITPTRGIVFGALAVLAVVLGMIYGTTFRSIKGAEERVGLEQQLDTVGQTIDKISTQDTEKVLDEGFVNLAERIDGISSVAVVVSNYERLKPYESAYGLENNIITDLWTSFIPRFLWRDKPLVFDARSYSDLYFNFNGNSYALTPVGDLIRNFGPIGVFVGMLVIGIFLRFAYAALIENQTITIGRATAYYLFLMSISFEGFYSTIFIYGWRIFALVFISFFFAEQFLIPKRKSAFLRSN